MLQSFKRFSTNAGIRSSITDLSVKKLGTGSGPFVEFPDIQPLHDSLLLRLPSFSSVVGRLNNITVIDASNELKNVKLTDLLAVKKQQQLNGFITLSTGDEPVNVICTASSRLNNVSVIEVDDYEKGWTITDPLNTIVCYAGDISVKGNQIKGRGLFAINGQSPSWHIQLKDSDQILVPATSILGYSSTVSVIPTKIKQQFQFKKMSWIKTPNALQTWMEENIKSKYEYLRLLINKYFQKDTLMADIRGPGLVIVQHQNSRYNENPLFTDESIIKALEK